MRVCICKRSDNYQWHKGGDEITYQNSKIVKRSNADKSKIRYYNQMSFTY